MRNNLRAQNVVFLLSLVALLCDCSQATRRLLDDAGDGDGDVDVDADSDGDGDGDADGGGSSWCSLAEVARPRTNQADILFVIDDTSDMAEEQNVLAEQFVVMLQQLIDPADSDMPTIDDLHVGVVSTNMGSHPYEIETCYYPDNGVLQNEGRLSECRDEYSAPDCDRDICPWLRHSSDYPDDGSDPSNPPIWEDLGCISTLGSGGCGFEQPLEASYAALVEQAGPGGPNEGFLREDSLVAVIYVTTEDDCSASDPEIFNPTRDDLAPINVRCAFHPEMLHPVDRYYDALRSVRPGREDLVFVAAIVGVPVDGSWNPGDPIELLREMQQIDPEDPSGSSLVRSCDTAMGGAWHPVRFAELVYAFGRNGFMESICRSDWTPALQMVTRAIQGLPPGSCVSADIDDVTLAGCRLIETLSDDRECPHLADGTGSERSSGWHVDLGVDEEGQRQCQILRADYDGDGCPDGDCDCEGDIYDPNPYRGCLQGWFYRAVNPPCEHGRLELTRRNIAARGSVLSFECLTESCPG